MSPRIAIEALSLGHPPQGIGAYILNLASALAREPGEMEYLVFLRKEDAAGYTGLEGPRLRLVPCTLPPGRAARILYQHAILPGKVREERADLLHGVANLLPAWWRGPSVLTVHDLDFRAHPAYSPPARRLLFRWLTPGSLRRASAVTTVSTYSAGTVARYYPSVPPAKIRVVPSCPPAFPVLAKGEIRDILDGYGLAGEYFLVVGSLELRKNVTAAVEAFNEYRRRFGGGAKLVLVGQPGYGFERIARSLAGSPWTGDIVRPGYVPFRHLPALYGGAAALLFLSEAEGFGLPALEAMACGCPVIAARAGALPETCGDAALLVPPGDAAAAAEAARRAAVGGEARRELVSLGFRNLARFSWAGNATLFRGIYREVLAKARAG